jgi:peptidyl-prolyl cis-trans isomerase C
MSQRILLAAVMAVAISACNKKAEGQTVAVVNNEEVTASELNALLSNSNSAAGSDTKAARAAALQNLIDEKLLVQQARSDGLDKSPEFLNQQRRMNDELLIKMLVSRKLNTSQLPSADTINGYEAAHPGMFANREILTLQQVLYALPKNPAVTSQIAAAKTIDEIAQVLTSNGIQFTKNTRKIDTAIFPQGIYAQIMALKAGEPFVAPGGDRAVASVIVARDPAPITGDAARQVALNAMRRDDTQQILQDRVKSLRATAKIQYQPGFEPPKK